MNREDLESIVIEEFARSTPATQLEMFKRSLQQITTNDLERWITQWKERP